MAIREHGRGFWVIFSVLDCSVVTLVCLVCENVSSYTLRL